MAVVLMFAKYIIRLDSSEREALFDLPWPSRSAITSPPPSRACRLISRQQAAVFHAVHRENRMERRHFSSAMFPFRAEPHDAFCSVLILMPIKRSVYVFSSFSLASSMSFCHFVLLLFIATFPSIEKYFIHPNSTCFLRC